MKRIFCIMLSMGALSLVGCGDKEPEPTQSATAEPEVPMSAEPAEPTGVMNAEPVSEPSEPLPEPTMAPDGKSEPPQEQLPEEVIEEPASPKAQ